MPTKRGIRLDSHPRVSSDHIVKGFCSDRCTSHGKKSPCLFPFIHVAIEMLNALPPRFSSCCATLTIYVGRWDDRFYSFRSFRKDRDFSGNTRLGTYSRGWPREGGRGWDKDHVVILAHLSYFLLGLLPPHRITRLPNRYAIKGPPLVSNRA